MEHFNFKPNKYSPTLRLRSLPFENIFRKVKSSLNLSPPFFLKGLEKLGLRPNLNLYTLFQKSRFCPKNSFQIFWGTFMSQKFGFLACKTIKNQRFFCLKMYFLDKNWTIQIVCVFKYLTHCSKTSFFVQKFNFDSPRKLSIFWG